MHPHTSQKSSQPCHSNTNIRTEPMPLQRDDPLFCPRWSCCYWPHVRFVSIRMRHWYQCSRCCRTAHDSRSLHRVGLYHASRRHHSQDGAILKQAAPHRTTLSICLGIPLAGVTSSTTNTHPASTARGEGLIQILRFASRWAMVRSRSSNPTRHRRLGSCSRHTCEGHMVHLR